MSKNTKRRPKRKLVNHNYNKDELFLKRLRHILIAWVDHNETPPIIKQGFVKIPVDNPDLPCLPDIDYIEFFKIKNKIRGAIKIIESDNGQRINRYVLNDKNKIN